jgi:Rrf2 family iron-sulfur cluster assembly transcriptional regulator
MRLELTRRGDYAVRAMLALAAADGNGPLSARVISERMGVPVRFLPHVLRDLVHAGLIVGQTGRTGGYRLARTAGTIDLLTVVDAVEAEAEPARCVLRGGPCAADGYCVVHEPFAHATTSMRKALGETTLAAIVASTGLRGGLPALIPERGRRRA